MSWYVINSIGSDPDFGCTGVRLALVQLYSGVDLDLLLEHSCHLPLLLSTFMDWLEMPKPLLCSPAPSHPGYSEASHNLTRV